MKRQTKFALALGFCMPMAHAQQPAVSMGPDAWMVPIHTQPDDPIGGAYGTWAAGPDYKVSFDDGMTFYPVLGTTYPENLPLRWRTERIEVGQRLLVDGTSAAIPAASPWRYELGYGEVTEAYDVLREGVEQTFVLHEPVPGGGDLVVTGTIATPLSVDTAMGGRSTAEHAALSFADTAGNQIVSFGAAFGIDSAGRRLEVDSKFDGTRVEMRIPSEWLAAAVYPVILDPLFSRVVIPPVAVLPATSAQNPNVARDDAGNRILLSYGRNSSASDFDAWARLLSDDMQPIGLVFSDITASWATRYTAPAWVRGAGDWALALGRDFAAVSAVRVYVHEASDLAANTGVTMFLSPPGGFSDQFPSIGGNVEPGLNGGAYLVFQRDAGGAKANSANSQVMGVTVDTPTTSFGVPQDLHTQAGSFDDEWPMITPDRGVGGDWIVVWMGLNYANSNDDWDVIGQRVTNSGALGGLGVFGPSATASRHKIHPAVAGRDGRYAVSLFLRDNDGAIGANVLSANELMVQRFDWALGAAAPVKMPPQSVASSGAINDYVANSSNRPIAYDNNTDSHWAVVYRNIAGDLFVVRFGFSGLVVESATVFSDPGLTGYSPTVCYNDDDYEFCIVYPVAEPVTNPLYGTRLAYQGAANTSYGNRCPGAITGDNRGVRNEPFAGSEFYGLRLTGGRSNATTVLLVGAGSATVPLPVSNCNLLLNPAFPVLTVASGVSTAGGDFLFQVPLHDSVTNADLFWQYIQVDSGQIYASNALVSAIR